MVLQEAEKHVRTLGIMLKINRIKLEEEPDGGLWRVYLSRPRPISELPYVKISRISKPSAIGITFKSEEGAK